MLVCCMFCIQEAAAPRQSYYGNNGDRSHHGNVFNRFPNPCAASNSWMQNSGNYFDQAFAVSPQMQQFMPPAVELRQFTVEELMQISQPDLTAFEQNFSQGFNVCSSMIERYNNIMRIVTSRGNITVAIDKVLNNIGDELDHFQTFFTNSLAVQIYNAIIGASAISANDWVYLLSVLSRAVVEDGRSVKSLAQEKLCYCYDASMGSMYMAQITQLNHFARAARRISDELSNLERAIQPQSR